MFVIFQNEKKKLVTGQNAQLQSQIFKQIVKLKSHPVDLCQCAYLAMVALKWCGSKTFAPMKE